MIIGAPNHASETSVRPPAVMRVVGKVATVCAWHGPKPVAKDAADAWAKAEGLTVSHGCCSDCREREFPDVSP